MYFFINFCPILLPSWYNLPMKTKKNISLPNLIFYFIIALGVFCFVLFETISPAERHDYASDVIAYPGTFYQVLPDGSTKNIPSLPANLDVDEGETLVIESVIPSIKTTGKYFCMRSSQQSLYFYIDGELRSKYDTKDTALLSNADCASGYAFCPLAPEDSGKILRIESYSSTYYNGHVHEPIMGTEFDMWFLFIKQNFFETCIDAFLFIIGLIAIIAGIMMRITYKERQPLEYLGWIVVLASLTIFSESHLRQMIVPNASILSDFTYYLLNMTLYVVLLFLDTIQKERYHKAYQIPEIAVLVNYFLILTLAFTGKLELFKSLNITIILEVGVVLFCLVTFVLDIKSGFIKEYTTVAIGLVLFAVCASSSHLFVNVLNICNSIGVFFCTGLLLLFFASLYKTLGEVSRINEEKQREAFENKAKEQFFTSISREIRTPINGVLGMNEMILRESKDATITEYARNIDHSGKVLLALINDLLDFTKADCEKLKLNVEKYSSATMLVDMVKMFGARATDKNLEFNYLIDPKLPSVLMGDQVRINQIMSNLLSNAIKYTPSGSITMSVNTESIKDSLAIIKFSVTDTGQGIKSDNLDKLFEAYPQINDSENKSIEGSGLGLSITKQLVDLMGGTISVKSEYGKGSTFTVILPQEIVDSSPIGNFKKLCGDPASDESQKGPKKLLKAPGKHVLIVDDNKVNLAVIKGLLKHSEMDLSIATGGQQSIDMCHDNKYDVILMDHMMPEINGIDALKAIKADSEGKNQNTPIIALTANAYQGIREMYIRVGFADYIAKPIDSEILDTILLGLIDGAYWEE